MIPPIGIDLGTTFCCVSYIGPDGPVIIPDLEGNLTTPSTTYFTGARAGFGKKAAGRKHDVGAPVYEFFKRDMGAGDARAGRYKIGGYDYQAAGLQAVLLRYLRAGAVRYFVTKGLLDPAAADTIQLPAIITVPAYFMDRPRLETRIAGFAAGLEVLDIVDEPVAAALTYGIGGGAPRLVLVFDLGGGTFDVTLIRIGGGQAQVITKNGAQELGGRDWDLVIEQYLHAEYEQEFDREIPDELGWQVQELALQAKLALSDAPHTTVRLAVGTNQLARVLYRDRESVPPGVDDADDFSFDLEVPQLFVFEERCNQLLSQCRTLLAMLLEDAGKSWNELDDIVLAGGSSRMPMIRKMLATEAGRPLTLVRPNFDYDTAISTGAALYSRQFGAVTNVLGHTIGIKVQNEAGHSSLRHLLKKDTPVPQAIYENTFRAMRNAVLEVYEGESLLDDALLRGSLPLENPEEGPVKVRLEIGPGGIIVANVSYDSTTLRRDILPDGISLDPAELTRRIRAVSLDLPVVAA